jgi:H-NS histone family
VRVVGSATREGNEDAVPAVDLRSPVARGRKGGTARAKSLSPERKREIAEIAARARWGESKAPHHVALSSTRVQQTHAYTVGEETRAVTAWKYQRINLSEQRPRSDELDMLNTAGADGWELVAITSNNIAYLKRPIEEPVQAPSVYSAEATRPTDAADVNGASQNVERAYVQPKYRDPTTNETWSGRGRMASWLKRKQEAGENIDTYLV